MITFNIPILHKTYILAHGYTLIINSDVLPVSNFESLIGEDILINDIRWTLVSILSTYDLKYSLHCINEENILSPYGLVVKRHN